MTSIHSFIQNLFIQVSIIESWGLIFYGDLYNINYHVFYNSFGLRCLKKEESTRHNPHWWPCAPFSPFFPCGCATERADPLLGLTWPVLLPGDRRSKLCVKWDVLLIQLLAQPEMALMGVVMSPNPSLTAYGHWQQWKKVPPQITDTSCIFICVVFYCFIAGVTVSLTISHWLVLFFKHFFFFF